MTRPLVRALLAALPAMAWLAVAGCANPPAAPDAKRAPEAARPPEPDRAWASGTPAQAARIADLVARLKTAKGEEAIDVDRQLIAEGEPALPALVSALSDPEPAVRGQAAYVLGYVKDRRTLPALFAATADPVPVVRYEAAAALLELQDARGFAILVGGLSDADPRLRAKCADVLAERTGQRLGFDPLGPPDERAAAVRRWRAWLAQRGL